MIKFSKTQAPVPVNLAGAYCSNQFNAFQRLNNDLSQLFRNRFYKVHSKVVRGIFSVYYVVNLDLER